MDWESGGWAGMAQGAWPKGASILEGGGGPDPQLSPSSGRLFLETWGRGATPKMLFLKWAFPEPASSTSPKICSKKVQNQTCLLQPRGWGPHNMSSNCSKKVENQPPKYLGRLKTVFKTVRI